MHVGGLGIINKLLIDEKGTTIVVVFGLPPAGAHADDPVRACLTALAVSDLLRNQNLPSSMGIATGRLFCGVYGQKDKRAEYAILGSTVNLSARLMCFTTNTILVDEMTYERSKDVLMFEKWMPIKLKGLDKDVLVFRPLQKIKERTEFTSAKYNRDNNVHIGNEEEKMHITKALQDFIEGKSLRKRIIVVKGNAGNYLFLLKTEFFIA
ncbi:adenylate cyclase type 10-like [Zophobas morio]|uniref:adenylate cyclase type 10-like n=1 Tax=Zophobas morio TaxID=2755281 RepID=UPI003082C758